MNGESLLNVTDVKCWCLGIKNVIDVINGSNLLKKINRFVKFVMKYVRYLDIRNVMNVINGVNLQKKIKSFVNFVLNHIIKSVMNWEDFLERIHGFVNFVMNYMIPAEIKLLMISLDVHKLIVIIKL